jgi:hypothetical protein
MNSQIPAERPVSEQSQELVATDTRRLDDRVERPPRKIASVHRHHHAVATVRMTEYLVASPDAIKLPAAAQSARTACRGVTAGSPWRHAETVTRSISIGPGVGSP